MCICLLERCGKKAAQVVGVSTSSYLICFVFRSQCSGDSGGPLIVNKGKDNDILVGLVSWGRGCQMYPGVYGRVSSVYQWVRRALCTLSVAPPVYLKCSTAGATGFDAEEGTDSSPPPTNQPTPVPTELVPVIGELQFNTVTITIDIQFDGKSNESGW